MADDRFGPNTAEVEVLFDRFRRLTPEEWERMATAAPGVGAIPDLEVRQSPEYFKALEVATRIAKSEVFPGSESAFYDAMRTAQVVADASAFQPSTRPVPASTVKLRACPLVSAVTVLPVRAAPRSTMGAPAVVPS